MSAEKYPNFGSVFSFADSMLGCVFGILKFFSFLLLIGFVLSLFK